MPGLTDAHAHLVPMSNTILQLHASNLGLIYARTLAEAKKTLLRGFTTIRDMGGDSVGVKQAIDQGVADGPRIYPSRAMISQTSGHGDFGLPYDPTPSLGGPSSRGEQIGMTQVADGADCVLAAVREQLKLGATQIKLMAGGGVSSFYDHLDTLQFTAAEMRAAVDAAADWGTYVAVHVYNRDGVRRAVESGVQCIEHGHLMDEETVKFMADHGAWLSTQPWAEEDHHFPRPPPGGEEPAGVRRCRAPLRVGQAVQGEDGVRHRRLVRARAHRPADHDVPAAGPIHDTGRGVADGDVGERRIVPPQR